MFHTVIIPSAKRPQILHETIASMLQQQTPADQILITVADKSYVLPETLAFPKVQIVLARPGLCQQVNDAIPYIDSCATFVSILDDDVELAPDYFTHARIFSEEHPEVAAFSGFLVRNGNVERSEGRSLLLSFTDEPDRSFEIQSTVYGCNINTRPEVLRTVKFDERLPLYGWLCDADFGFRCRKFGICVSYNACRLVHLMTSSGRISGTRMGFAQIMNPYYLYRKGVIPFWEVLQSHWLIATRNNLIKLFFLDQKIDRQGRLKGNIIAFFMILRGQIEPEFMEKLS
ncbi:glycosyltransferase [Nostocaceae cyanobacterium CENA369]|uniref:Glycosyltransferase n=1 Tax=Dendronalium phyllosphericum CENA369 TaxID=1725256 RepID=A0A8J7I7L9_9NOST|nr:glycosyltransferase [Dendronalium phyllosphericum]MBH8576310.1 glycosyltransferase [Dendronalium phyllosphericum CENA369]